MCIELPDFGSESAKFPIEYAVLLADAAGVAFFNGTLPLPPLPCPPPKAELTKSPNKFVSFFAIPIPNPDPKEPVDVDDDDQLLPKMSPTIDVGPPRDAAPADCAGPGAPAPAAGWWVHEGLLGCHAGLDGCAGDGAAAAYEKEVVLFF